MTGILLISHGPLAQGFAITTLLYNDETYLMDILCLQEDDIPGS